MPKPWETEPRSQLVKTVLACFAAGVALDFIFSGVCKIVWVGVYLPCYLALASTFATWLVRTRWKTPMTFSAAIFLAGTLLGHFFFVGHSGRRIYSMEIAPAQDGVAGSALPADKSAFVFRSKLWPQMLYVTSDPLRAQLAQHPTSSPVQVVMSYVTDYGCYRSFRVELVDGVDVMGDKNANWVWKTDPAATSADSAQNASPGSEDQKLPWCLYSIK